MNIGSEGNGKVGVETESGSCSDSIAGIVCNLLRNANVNTVLEVEPSRGSYTLKLAASCRQLYCVDSSEDVLNGIQQAATKLHLNNIVTLKGKWEEWLPFPCDGVFAYNCFYQVDDLERCLMKIHESASEICVIGVDDGSEMPYYRDFEQKLGFRVRETQLKSKDLKKVLKGLGISPSIVITVPCEREYVYNSWDELVEHVLAKVAGSYDEQAAKEVLRRHVVYQDGKYRCRHHFTSELICWYKRH